MSALESHRSGKASVTNPLDALREECAPIGRRLGHRRSLRVAGKLFAVLISGKMDPTKAAEFVQAVAGVKPSEWLTVSEAHAELRRMGIRKSRRFLYRLGRKLASASGPAEIWLDAHGNWGGRGQVSNAVAVLVVKGGSTPRFRFLPASSPVTKPANP